MKRKEEGKKNEEKYEEYVKEEGGAQFFLPNQLIYFIIFIHSLWVLCLKPGKMKRAVLVAFVWLSSLLVATSGKISYYFLTKLLKNVWQKLNIEILLQLFKFFFRFCSHTLATLNGITH